MSENKPVSADCVPPEKDAISACPVCEHRAIWHHDERGCQYHGNSALGRCPCRRNSDQIVAQIISRAMHKAADEWFDAIVTGHPTPPAGGGES